MGHGAGVLDMVEGVSYIAGLRKQSLLSHLLKFKFQSLCEYYGLDDPI